MEIRADAVAIALLTEVHRTILVAQNRMYDLALFAGQLAQWRGLRVLMLAGNQRDRHARHASDARPPDAGAEEHFVRLDPAAVSQHRFDAAAFGFDSSDCCPGVEFGSVCF